MNITDNNQWDSDDSRNFWDSLQMDIFISNQTLSKEELMSFIERSFIFSMFFRGCPPLELIGCQKILNIKDNGYVLIIELSEHNKSNIVDLTIDEFKLSHYIKNTFKNKNIAIGPLNTNRISLLITDDTISPEQKHKSDSVMLSKAIMHAIGTQFQLSVSIGIGSMQCLNSIYTSYVDALSCLYYSNPDQILFYLDLKKDARSINFDYLLTEKHLLEAIRLRKTEAYDYFGMIMEWIRPLNDDTKRNKILEILVLANHAMRLDSQTEIKFMNYTGYVNQFMELKGDQLIEFAYQSFIYITSYVKPQNSIDYTNHIVRATREFLEQHYAEDISLEDVAEQVNISPQYYSKLIKKTTGFNFIDWLSMLRVKKAKELLNNSDYTVKEVCFMVGYKDPNYFSRIFKKRIGITPSEYVKTSSYLNNKS
jgi:two-component system response regulator YesN